MTAESLEGRYGPNYNTIAPFWCNRTGYQQYDITKSQVSTLYNMMGLACPCDECITFRDETYGYMDGIDCYRKIPVNPRGWYYGIPVFAGNPP